MLVSIWVSASIDLELGEFHETFVTYCASVRHPIRFSHHSSGIPRQSVWSETFDKEWRCFGYRHFPYPHTRLLADVSTFARSTTAQRIDDLVHGLGRILGCGQGMHLSANSIGHLLSEARTGEIHELTHFYDEVLSHYLWHFGVVGLSALILYRQWRNPFSGQPEGVAAAIVGGLIYGFTYFAAVLEAGTAPLGVPFAIAVALYGLIWGRKQFREQPMTTFFVTAYSLATLLILIWLIWQGGLPQPSEVGFL